MIRTPFCEVMGIEHPVALGGMGSIFAPRIMAAVSEAGGLGAHFHAGGHLGVALLV